MARRNVVLVVLLVVMSWSGFATGWLVRQDEVAKGVLAAGITLCVVLVAAAIATLGERR